MPQNSLPPPNSQDKMLTPLQKKALATLDNNRKVRKTRYTPPSPHHYPNGYLWDSNFVAIVYAVLGEGEKGKQEIEEVLSWQHKKTGFIPNIKLGKGRYFDPERLTFSNPDISSDYTQPPFHARAAWEIYKSLGNKKGKAFLKQNYNSLSLAYKYFINTRTDKGNLVNIIHPHETGRDSDPTFDFIKFRLPVAGVATPILIQYINTVLDYGSALFLNVRLAQIGWNINKIKKSKVFWVKDLMFNCIYENNLETMVKIAKTVGKRRDAKLFKLTGKKVEDEILNNLYDKKTEMFYSQNYDGKLIKKISINNLAPLMLPHINSSQIVNLLEMLEDKKFFNTPFPIPSVPANSDNFDPHYDEKRLWRGTTWINTIG